jgi:hypothetical protein
MSRHAKARATYSHGQQEYTLPAVPSGMTGTQPAGACWYTTSGGPPAAGKGGSPPHDTTYSLGAHLFVHVAGPLIDSQPGQLVGSSEMQSWFPPPSEEPSPERSGTPPQLNPSG